MMANYRHLNVFRKPQRLVYSGKEGNLILDDVVLREVSTITHPVVVIAISGLYRTGKSYLMNRIARAKTGFPLGSSVQATTKGVWIWCTEHPLHTNTILLLIDTEGLGDVIKGDVHHDNKILTLALMLCRVMCYNHIGLMDTDMIEKLAFTSKLARKIYLDPSKQRLSLSPPSLIVCLRDFCLELEENGQTITEKEYLENSLKSKEGNINGEEIKTMFKDRQCFTFERPGGKRILQNLEHAREDDLSRGFLDATEKFVSYVYKFSPSLMPNNKPVTGEDFAGLLRFCVKDLNDGSLPQAPQIVHRWMIQKDEKITQQILDVHKRHLDSILLPILSTKEFDTRCRTLSSSCEKEIEDNTCLDSSRRFAKRASDELLLKIQRLKVSNDTLCYSYWKREISHLYDQRIGDSDAYYHIGGFLEYKKKLKDFKSTLNQGCPFEDEEQRTKAFQAYMETKQADEKKIFEKDRQLTEKQEREERRIAEENYKRQRERQDRELQKILRQQRENAECERKRQEYLEREKEREYQQKLERARQEHEEYMHQRRLEMQRLEREREEIAQARAIEQERQRQQEIHEFMVMEAFAELLIRCLLRL